MWYINRVLKNMLTEIQNKQIGSVILMKKLLITAFATTSLLLAGCSDRGAEVASTEAGRIREQDLYEQMKSEPLQSGLTVGETVLQKMLLEDIFEHLYGDQVTEEDVDAEIEKSAEPFGTMEEYRELLEAQGIDPNYVRENVYLSLLMEAAVLDNVEITDEMLEEQYEAQKPDFTAQHILVEDEETANDIIAQLEDGADFAELVTEHSQDPGSVENEGKYTFNEGEMVPEFENAVNELEAGETTSEPVESAHGFHVIRRLELEYAPFEEQRDQLEEDVINGYIQDQQFMTNLITDLAAEANVQIADEELMGAMASYMPQPETEGESENETEDVPAEEEAPADESGEEGTSEEETPEEPVEGEEESSEE